MVAFWSNETSENSDSNGEVGTKSDKLLFVPVKKRGQLKGRSGVQETVNSVVGIMKTVIEMIQRKISLNSFKRKITEQESTR